jgi:hypothetical protein
MVGPLKVKKLAVNVDSLKTCTAMQTRPEAQETALAFSRLSPSNVLEVTPETEMRVSPPRQNPSPCFCCLTGCKCLNFDPGGPGVIRRIDNRNSDSGR